MTNATDIEQKIRAHVLNEFLPGEDPAQLTNTTPLVTTGVIDSIATLKLVAFLEQEFTISIAAHEAGAEYLDTIERMRQLVVAKRS